MTSFRARLPHDVPTRSAKISDALRRVAGLGIAMRANVPGGYAWSITVAPVHFALSQPLLEGCDREPLRFGRTERPVYRALPCRVDPSRRMACHRLRTRRSRSPARIGVRAGNGERLSFYRQSSSRGGAKVRLAASTRSKRPRPARLFRTAFHWRFGSGSGEVALDLTP